MLTKGKVLSLQLAKVLHSYDGHLVCEAKGPGQPTTNGYVGAHVKINLLQVDTVVL